MTKAPPEELIALYNEVVAATKNGDVEAAADAVLQASAYQGIVNGNIKALELYLIGSGAIEGIKDRKRVASKMANSAVRLIASEKEESVQEVDYAARLSEESSD